MSDRKKRKRTQAAVLDGCASFSGSVRFSAMGSTTRCMEQMISRVVSGSVSSGAVCMFPATGTPLCRAQALAE